ncbi:DUF4360 domain-containing protein [Paractinoplanes toevensis]|uniref:DUF4360 domain-containing protein n=1 Tax=Paractinoplanes toevensis TaxID=571911 RepID=A0A919WBB0_9ACTN|nr:DUF4360 domain-containing protein [Actinoplanes toevensis]GIM96962.1 hypothetical protein Ato02nite_087550 [Actinoplanes toevensis]
MTFRLAALASATVLAALSLSGPARADAALTPPSGQVTLDVQTVNGSGCPAGTASAAMQSDNTAFKISYSQYLAEDGGSTDPTDFRKNCQVNVLVHIPQGFTFAIARADYWGKMHLESGATALERANYYFQGSSDNNYVDHPFTGPYDGSWRATDITETADLVWAPCGVTRSLNINTELRVYAGTSTRRSYISMRASDGEVYTLVQFQWKQC